VGFSAPSSKRAAATIALAVLSACAPRTPSLPAAAATHGSLSVLRVDADPTIQGARIVPEMAGTNTTLGLEPGGGVRSLAAGMRVVSLSNGGVLTSEQRFADAPKPFALPSRLGGGFLFVVSPVLYRAESWLSPVRPIFSSPTGIADVILGLDRVYVRAPNGSHQALDPRSGKLMDLAPWPPSPFVGAYRALDGWRAVALTDLRGAVATFDAGASWKTLALPMEPKSVDIARVDAASGEPFLASPFGTPGDFLVIRGTEADRQTAACYAVRADESTARLPACPAYAPPDAAPAQTVDAAMVKSFGNRPLLAAVEDGWPVDSRTAVVARDGVLARIRLADGAISSVIPDAFPSNASRCHPFPLLADSGPPGLGFACGDANGRTLVYAYDAGRPGLTELRRFEHARAVLSFGNGSIAVRGPCAEDGPSGGPQFCVLSRGREASGSAARTPRWREVALPPAPESSPSRLLVFSDGHVAELFPPRGRIEDSHLAFVDGGKVTSVPLQFDAAPPEAIRALESGVWLDGFEEREPGTLGGWVDAAGAMLGVRIGEDGHVEVGAYIRDAGSPVVSGRYGLGWGASRRGYETTDGGMTWNTIEVPEPLAAPRERACGPIGCTAAGWIRVGWGIQKEVPVPAGIPSLRAPFRPPHELDLVCEGTDPIPPAPPVQLSEPLTLPLPHFLAAASLEAPKDVPGLFRTLPPPKRSDEVMVWADALDPTVHFDERVPLARIYAWGPVAGEWARTSRWTVRWLWPYGSSRDVRSTSSAPAAFPTFDAARRILGQPGSANVVNWWMAVGDEPSSALLFGKSLGQEITALELEADRAPVAIRRADGEPFNQVDFAVRAEAHWYIATPQAYGELPASIVWRVDGTTAHEFARVPRGPFDSSPAAVRLARRSDGRAIGLVVDGQPPPDRGVGVRWVLPLDLESGAAGEPESLGAADLGDRQVVPLCADGDAGWILDTTWSATAAMAMEARKTGEAAASGSLRNLYARERLSDGRACIQRLSGTYEPNPTPDAPSTLPEKGSQDRGASIVVSALRSHTRYSFRCHWK
jgi:hypothetical protein